MSDTTTTLLGGIEPPIYRLTAGRLNHWATEALRRHLDLNQGPVELQSNALPLSYVSWTDLVSDFLVW